MFFPELSDDLETMHVGKTKVHDENVNFSWLPFAMAAFPVPARSTDHSSDKSPAQDLEELTAHHPPQEFDT